METTLNEMQQAILDSLGTLLERHVSDEEVLQKREPEYAHGLEQKLDEAGLLDVFAAENSYLDAALVTERVGRATPVLPIGWRTILWPALDCDIWPLVPWKVGSEEPTRFGDSARAVLVIDEERDVVSVVDIADCEVRSAGAQWGYPLAYIRPCAEGRALSIPAADCLALWRVTLATEILGAAGAAFDHTVEYLNIRKQFGHPIGANQAIRHRVAQVVVEIEKARWLTYEAAWRAPDPELAASAAMVAVMMAKLVFEEMHQMYGAIGYTRELPLHRWTMRLHVLGKELGGEAAHGIAVTAAHVS